MLNYTAARRGRHMADTDQLSVFNCLSGFVFVLSFLIWLTNRVTAQETYAIHCGLALRKGAFTCCSRS